LTDEHIIVEVSVTVNVKAASFNPGASECYGKASTGDGSPTDNIKSTSANESLWLAAHDKHTISIFGITI